MVDLKAQHQELAEEIDGRIRDIFDSGAFILGPNVMELERRVAEYHQLSHALGLASGTDALHLALRAAGVGPGDEVITTPFTFFATVEAIHYCGATPVFVDIEPDTFNLDAGAIEARLTARTRAIVPVHLFGHPAAMDEIMAIAGRHDLVVIEDCAQAFGADIRGRKTGGFGAAGCYSFYPSKNFSCYGDGGMVVTDSVAIHERIRRLRNHGSTRTYYHEEVGYNSRLDEMQAAVLNVKMRRIDGYNDQRRAVADRYRQGLADLPLGLPVERQGYRHVYHQFTIRSDRRDDIIAHLQRQGVSAVVYYPVPLHLQEALRGIVPAGPGFPEAEKAAREVFSIPMYPELPETSVDFICEQLRGFFKS
jgi:dTDP-4-amino-4,6-dideoxygalactose transaminase